jgi:hypothetical protein
VALGIQSVVRMSLLSMTLETVWSRLCSIRDLTFNASSSASTGWTGSGVGTVSVAQPASDVLVYTESGTWTQSGGKQLSFSNVYRWTLQPQVLRLEHLRFGADNPVYLFDLGIVSDSRMASVDPHV